MLTEAFDCNVDINDEFITVRWTRLPHVPDTGWLNRYPEFQIRFRYRDISTDTVSSMLKDMDVPSRLQKAIMTRVAANAA